MAMKEMAADRSGIDKDESATTVVLLCGLPASGKSTLAHWLLTSCQDSKTTVHHIEYDAVEGTLLEEKMANLTSQKPSGQEERWNDEFSREIWKQSRSHSLELLKKRLDLHATKTTTQHNKQQLIIMDDNFHLRSMRREVFRICQECVAENDSTTIFFVILWLDVCKETCLQRNYKRTRKVPDDVIERMHETLEAPGKESFERCFLRVHDVHSLWDPFKELSSSTPSCLSDIQHFIFRDSQKSYAPVLPPSPPIDTELLEEERKKTRESWLHSWDQRLRLWVGNVARISRQDTPKANQARKELLKDLRQQLNETNDIKDLPTALQISQWFLNEVGAQWSENQSRQFQIAMQEET